ncbi:MAG: ATP-grasp domain-containing protein [Stackebrandtia sp.]
MTASNLVILGGGEDQIPAYTEGRRLGYHVVGVDRLGDALGAELSDEFFQVTTTDPERIAALLGERDVAAVISPASDVAQASAAELNRRYGCPHVLSEAAVRASEDKGYFREVLAKLGFPQPEYTQSRDLEELEEKASQMRLPLVVKPSDSFGGKGVGLCRRLDEFGEAAIEAARHSCSGWVVVEEFLQGRHCSVEQFAGKGKAALTVVTERGLTGPQHMTSASHTLPAELAPDVLTRLESMCATVRDELDHTDGPVNIDFVLTDDGEICFVELGARLGGNGMPMLVRHAYGVNTVEAAIRLAVGEPVDLESHWDPRHVTLRILQADRAGTLHSVRGLDEALSVPGVVDIQVFKRPGDLVAPYTQAAHKLGYLLAAADSSAELETAVDIAMKSLDFVISDDDSLEVAA